MLLIPQTFLKLSESPKTPSSILKSPKKQKTPNPTKQRVARLMNKI